ncbi:MAG TPA: hypothetical protein VNQ90_15680 [Chthoniobacteraceae bacterium]|nr:hypothetical protein [Chthoniobacteraceae bacterium]
MRYHLPFRFRAGLLPLALIGLLAGCGPKKEPLEPRTPDPTPTPTPVYALPDTTVLLSPKGYQLILDFEVGGGRAYYSKFLARPTVPPAQSGLTIGVGYDCGHYSKPVILRDWDRLPKPQPARLSEAAGKKQAAARAVLAKVKDILIPWADAEAVFNDVTLAQYYALAKSAYPGLEALHPDAQAVLVSLVFNRGSGMVGASRAEMRNIKPLVLKRDYHGIAAEIRSMKRLWPNIKGLLRHREAEATLMEACG